METSIIETAEAPVLPFALAFATLLLPSVGAAHPADPPEVPGGLTAADWSSIREAHEAGRHAARPVAGGYQAHNPRQRWRTHFDGSGFTTRPDAGSWSWGLELVRYGFAGHERAVARPESVDAEGQRVAYDWDDALEEWYINDARGLEHGYTVRRPAPGGGGGAERLTFTLALRGELVPEVQPDGRGVRFLDSGGAPVLTYSGLAVFDAGGRSLPAGFERVAEGLLLSVDERGARYPLTVDPVAQEAYLKASNTDVGDEFGTSVSVSGDTVVVGAENENSSATGVNGGQASNNALRSGAAYVFVRSATGWRQEAYLKASNTGTSDRFGYSVSVSGDTVVVGAFRESSGANGVNGNQGNNNASGAGAAYVFVRSGTSWSQQAYLKASNSDSSDYFGYSVAVCGDTVVVGAFSENSNATGVNGNQADNSVISAGAAYVFARSGATWSQQAYLKASNTETWEWFGISVAVSADTVVVGAWLEDSGATGVNGDQSDNGAVASGAAYVYVRSGTTWSQQAYLKASNTDEGDVFGRAVSVSGDTVLVGAPFESSGASGVDGDQSDNGATNAGAAYVFARSGTTWSQQAYLKASNPEENDRFGYSVSASGDAAVVGAFGEDGGATGVNGDQGDNSAVWSGAAYVFFRCGASWSQEAYLKASNTGADDWFGLSAAVSDHTVVLGAPQEDSRSIGVDGDQSDDGAQYAGAAYVFTAAADAGTSYCSANPNSTGSAAHIEGQGCPSVSTGTLVLESSPVPDTPGIFDYGPIPTQAAFGNGIRCVGGATTSSGVVFGSGNKSSWALEPSVPPHDQITAGSTWYFQHWFRDPAGGGSLFNLSDGLTVTFLP